MVYDRFQSLYSKGRKLASEVPEDVVLGWNVDDVVHITLRRLFCGAVHLCDIYESDVERKQVGYNRYSFSRASRKLDYLPNCLATNIERVRLFALKNNIKCVFNGEIL